MWEAGGLVCSGGLRVGSAPVRLGRTGGRNHPNWHRHGIGLCVDQLVTLPVETGRSHLRRGVVGNFRYWSRKQFIPTKTLITVAEHEYVIKNDMYAVFYPYAVAMLCYPVGG